MDVSAAEPLLKNFKCICSGIDLTLFREELLAAGEEVWLQDTSRRDLLPYHKSTLSIGLRGTYETIRQNDELHFFDRYHKQALLYPKLMAFLINFANERHCHLRKAALVKLGPKSDVAAHRDEDLHLVGCDRYHMVLQSNSGSLLFCGDEHVRMYEGELWWFNNKEIHHAKNEAASWRIHLIFDLCPMASQQKTARLKGVFAPSPSSQTLEWLIYRKIQSSEMGRLNNLLLQSKILDLCAEVFWDHFQGSGALTLVSLAKPIPLLIIGACLQEAAKRGLSCTGVIIPLDGPLPNDALAKLANEATRPVLAVLDLFESSDSLLKMHFEMARGQRRIQKTFCLFDPQKLCSSTAGSANAIDKSSIFRPSDFGFNLSELPTQAFTTEFCFAPKKPHKIKFIAPKSSPALANSILYYGTSSGVFHAVDVATGQERWSLDAGPYEKGILSSPLIHNGVVYFGSYGGDLFALDAQSGEKIWVCGVADFIGSSPDIAAELGLLFIGFEFSLPGQRGSLAAIDLASGVIKWQHRVAHFLHGSPAYSALKKTVGIGTNDKTFLMCDAKTGALLWELKLQGESKHKPVFTDQDRLVIFGSHDGKLRCVETETGRGLWHFQTDGMIFNTPLVVNNKVFFGSEDHNFYILDLQKMSLLCRIETDATIVCSPSFLNGMVFFGNNAGTIYALDPNTLRIVGTHQLPEAIPAQIGYDKKSSIYFAHTSDGRIFFFRTKSDAFALG